MSQEKITTAEKIKTGGLIAGITLVSIFSVKACAEYAGTYAEHKLNIELPKFGPGSIGADLNHHRPR